MGDHEPARSQITLTVRLTASVGGVMVQGGILGAPLGSCPSRCLRVPMWAVGLISACFYELADARDC
jgi:hypothetical protein